MPLKHKQKVYLSLNNDLLGFVGEQSHILNVTKSRYITNLLLKEYENYKRKKIDEIIEGAKEY